MKKYFACHFLGVSLLTTLFLCACSTPSIDNTASVQPSSFALTQTTTFGEDFDFPPLPPTHSVSDEFWDVSDVDVSAIDVSRRLIAFTFDDAPASTLENILAVFAGYNEANPDCPATATLFCNGNLFDENSIANLSAALTLGWELGNHTYSHADITTLSESELHAEIQRTETLLSKVDGKNAHLFRAPFGRINDEVKKAVNVPIIDWTIDTLDWTGTSVEQIYDVVFSQKFSGAIVLMHDGYPNTVDALKNLLPDLKDAGYQITSVSQMAKVHSCRLKNGGAYIRARKQGNG
ncbi:MAG: polysaccharide deacetylase family protein [Clostridia bacterium]|nr:polysaccharide deacetylase family protein [Clostridia bacterium]